MWSQFVRLCADTSTRSKKIATRYLDVSPTATHAANLSQYSTLATMTGAQPLWRADRPYHELSQLPPLIELETKAVLKLAAVRMVGLLVVHPSATRFRNDLAQGL
ncbi:hypothetical protein ACFS07_32050 [Undibacterium arcticum]